MRATVTWKNEMTFEGLTEAGFRITTAAAPPEGEPEQGHPKVFSQIALKYIVQGRSLDPAKTWSRTGRPGRRRNG